MSKNSKVAKKVPLFSFFSFGSFFFLFKDRNLEKVFKFGLTETSFELVSFFFSLQSCCFWHDNLSLISVGPAGFEPATSRL